jgi:hypothetical protein
MAAPYLRPWRASIGTTSNRNEAFAIFGAGLSLGTHYDVLDNGATDSGFAGGAWLSAGKAFKAAPPDHHCYDDDWRPYGVLVIGIRAEEFYLSPKLGVVGLPGFCL